MTISYRRFDSANPTNNLSLFSARLLDFVRALEDVDLPPYVDSKGIATIGVGYNLRVAQGRRNVIDALGFDPDLRLVPGGPRLTDAIGTVADRTYTVDAAGNTQLRSDINAVIALYYPDAATRPRPAFEFASAAEAATHGHPPSPGATHGRPPSPRSNAPRGL